jgi:hypothetical protein
MPRSLIKKISFRAVSDVDVNEMWERIKNISFISGPFICGLRGPWGEVQIWSNSHQESERVCLLLLQAGGWSSQDIAQAERWTSLSRRAAPKGQEMRPAIDWRGVPMLSKRIGGDGHPVRPTPV